MNTGWLDVGRYLAFGLQLHSELKEAREARQEQILREWEKSKELPRKKKKEVRKHLSLDWAIINYDVFAGV